MGVTTVNSPNNSDPNSPRRGEIRQAPIYREEYGDAGGHIAPNVGKGGLVNPKLRRDSTSAPVVGGHRVPLEGDPSD